MVMCHYFLQGRCRFGQNCRFEHTYNTGGGTGVKSLDERDVIPQVVEQIKEAENGGQWILSCFAPVKEAGCLPGINDISPEELRWELYNARANGNVDQTLQNISQLYKSAEHSRQTWKNPSSEVRKMVMDLASKKNSVAQSATGSNIFGNQVKDSFNFGTALAPSVFGGSSFTAGQTTQPTTNIFGGATQAQSPSQNIFSPQSNQNIFSTNSSANVFASSTATNSSNLFGGNTSTGSIFGTNSSTSGNMFGNNPSTTSGNVFGTSSLNNLFGTNSQNTSGNVFGTNLQGTSNNVFGNNSSNTPGGIFSTENIFGQSQPQTGNVFGAAATTVPNIFSKSDINTTSSQASDIFSKPVQLDLSVYTKLEDLTEEEKTLFSAPTFTFGKIPLRPPPRELC